MRIESGPEPGQFSVRLTSSAGSLFLVATTSFLKIHPVFRSIVGIIGLLTGLFGALLLFSGTIETVVAGMSIKLPGSKAPYLLAIGAGVLLLSFLATDKFTLNIGSEKEVEEREKAEEEIGDSPDPYNSLELAQKRLNEYYAINQSQARGSFRWAVFAMFVGLSTIVAGVWIFYFGDTPNAFLTSLSTAAGVVVNAISCLYLYMHNRTQRRALFYYGQLVRIQNLGLAIRLAESHEDPTLRADAKNRVIEEILVVVRTTAVEESKALATETK